MTGQSLLVIRPLEGRAEHKVQECLSATISIYRLPSCLSSRWLGWVFTRPSQPMPVQEHQLPVPWPIHPWRARLHVGSHISLYTHISFWNQNHGKMYLSTSWKRFRGNMYAFQKQGDFPKKLLWEGRIRANLSSSFNSIFFSLLLILHPCIAVTENTSALRPWVWEVRPSTGLTLPSTLPPNHREEQLRRPAWTFANIPVLASALVQSFDRRRTFYQYWCWPVSWVPSEDRRIENSV